MYEVLLLMSGGLIAGNVLAWWTNWVKMDRLEMKIREFAAEIQDSEINIPDLEDIKVDLMETFGNMRTPNAVDHIFGAVGRMIDYSTQIKAMKLQAQNLHEPAQRAEEPWQGAE